jgi:16S rRNA (uracil1498-N3)-methyltransferase
MVEAAEQCGRTALPELHPTQNLDSLLKNWQNERQLLFFDEEGGAPLYPTLYALKSEPCAILIGPEGGFDPAERTAIIAHKASVRLSLGPRILRADTAAVAAISVWQALKGDWQ